MAADVKIRLEVSADLERALRNLSNPAAVFREYLRGAGRLLVTTIRERYLRGPRPQRLGVRTGTLLRSITADESELPRAISVGTPLVYGPPHELGATIRPRSARMLAFRVGPAAHLGRGTLVFAKQVRLPARPFVAPAVESSLDALEELLLDEVKKATVE